MQTTIIFDVDKGGHFLDWSICFVSGKKEYYHYKSQKMLKVVENPVNGINSHGHQSNAAMSVNQLVDFYNHKNRNTNILLHQQDSEEQTRKAIDLVKQHSPKTILLKNHKDLTYYDLSYRKRNFPSQFRYRGSNDKEFFDYVTDKFVKNSKLQWDNFEELWDKREFIALNIEVFYNESTIYPIENAHEYDFEHYLIDTKEMFLDLNIQNLLNYLELPCEQQKLYKWQTVYEQWKKIHEQKMNFCLSFREIIDNIIENKSMDLTCFDLDVVQEGVIQHTLIYKYNLNLKTWKLEKFLNTSQLHNLLEDNTHF